MSNPDTSSAPPRVRDDLVVTPFAEGIGSAPGLKFVVEAGTACFLLNADALAVVRALQGSPATMVDVMEAYRRAGAREATVEEVRTLVDERLPRALFSDSPPQPRRTPFVVHRTLLPASLVQWISARFTWLYSPGWVVLIGVLFAVAVAISAPRGLAAWTSFNAGEVAMLVMLTFASLLIHEMGHASACSRFRCPPGDIGYGIYLYLPVMYTDVTRAWRLSPRQRAVVDLGGIYFQSLVVIGAAVWALGSDSALALKLILINLYIMLHALNPMFKMDGYWLLSDLSGLTNLHRKTWAAMEAAILRLLRRPPTSPAAEVHGVRGWVLNVYALFFVAYLVFIVHILATATRGLAATYPGRASLAVARMVDAIAAVAVTDALLALLTLLAISVGPLLITVATVYVGRRMLRMLGILFLLIFAPHHLRRTTPDPATNP
jgi:putative peptide zinc metalloprotease protein